MDDPRKTILFFAVLGGIQLYVLCSHGFVSQQITKLRYPFCARGALRIICGTFYKRRYAYT